MSISETLVFIFFLFFLAASLLRVVAMLDRKRAGLGLERDRLLFIFVASLMLVCLIPLQIFALLSRPVWAGNMAVVGANLAGWALSFEWRQERKEKEPSRSRVKVYQAYHQGEPFALVSREDFNRLLEYGLLKRGHTVELVDDYQQQARRQGVEVKLMVSRQGRQRLLRVEGPGGGEGRERRES